MAPRSRRPPGCGGLGRRAAAAAVAPPPGCWTGTAGCCAMASSTWPSTRRCPSPSRARGPAPASRAAVLTPPASATRAGWGTSASTARAGSSKCLRGTPYLSPAPHPSRPLPSVASPPRPQRGLGSPGWELPAARRPPAAPVPGALGPARSPDRPARKPLAVVQVSAAASGSLLLSVSIVSYGAKHHFC